MVTRREAQRRSIWPRPCGRAVVAASRSPFRRAADVAAPRPADDRADRSVDRRDRSHRRSSPAAVAGRRCRVAGHDRLDAAFRGVLDALALIADERARRAYDAAQGSPNDLERRTIAVGGDLLSAAARSPTVGRCASRPTRPTSPSRRVFKTRLEQALIKAEPGDATIDHGCWAARCRTRSTRRSRSPLAYVADGQTSAPTGIAAPIWTENFLDARDRETGARQARRPARPPTITGRAPCT